MTEVLLAQTVQDDPTFFPGYFPPQPEHSCLHLQSLIPTWCLTHTGGGLASGHICSFAWYPSGTTQCSPHRNSSQPDSRPAALQPHGLLLGNTILSTERRQCGGVSIPSFKMPTKLGKTAKNNHIRPGALFAPEIASPQG